METSRTARIRLVLISSALANNPAATAPINTRYPPKVFGSPISPSKGALTLPPPGICIMPYIDAIKHVRNMQNTNRFICSLSPR